MNTGCVVDASYYEPDLIIDVDKHVAGNSEPDRYAVRIEEVISIVPMGDPQSEGVPSSFRMSPLSSKTMLQGMSRLNR